MVIILQALTSEFLATFTDPKLKETDVQLLIEKGELALSAQNTAGNTLLHIAVLQGSVELTKKILVADPFGDVNITNDEGQAPLHIAIAMEQTTINQVLFSIPKLSGQTKTHLSSESVAHLLVTDRRCNLTIGNHNGNTLLHLATIAGNSDLCKLILSNKWCDPNILNKDGAAPLHIATMKNDLDVIKSLLSHHLCNPNIVYKEDDVVNMQLHPNSDGNTPLHLAAVAGNSDLCKLILGDKRCDPNILNKDGAAPLHVAIMKNDLDVIEPLLNHHLCNPNIIYKADNIVSGQFHPNSDGNTTSNMCRGTTPLHIAAEMGNVQLSELVASHRECDINLQDKEGKTPLHIATESISEFSVLLIQTLNHKQFNPNIQDCKGNTPLHLAIMHNNSSAIDLILRNEQINPNILNNERNTAVHIALLKNSTGVAEVLINHSLCDINIQDMNGNSPLHLAIIQNNSSAIDFLLRNKQINPNLLNNEHNTAVHIALQKDSTTVTEMLINHSLCDVNVQDINGNTYLHLAIEQYKSDIADMLINKKCDLTVPNSNGDTPLHFGCIHAAEDPNILTVTRSLLSSATVDPSCANNAGQTPVELTTNYQLIQDISHFTECKTEHSVQTYIKLFILGNPSTGKSTLVEAVCKEASWWWRLLPGILRRVKKVPAKTAGIIPTTFRSKTFGNTIIYDLAGQYEYYSSHAAVIESTVFSSPPAFLVVIDLSEDDEKIVKQLKYWWSFISNHAIKAIALPQVILVGSHADVLVSRGMKVDDKLSHITSLSKELSASFHFAGHVALDCRDPVSRGLHSLCSLVKTSCTALRASADIDLHCHALYAFLLERFGNTVACSVSDIAIQIRGTDTLLPKHPEDLIQLLSSLSNRGLIVLVVNSEHIGEGRVILQKQVLLNEISGTIFAPESFSQHRNFSSTGIVSRSRIQKEFPHYDTNMIVEFLTYLEFCFQVEDTEILAKIYTEFSISNADLSFGAAEASDKFYFFPGLVSIDNPLSVWKDDGSIHYQCGWHCESANPDQFLTTRFLHVLILRLAFLFTLPAVNRQPSSVLCKRCAIWKHGIGWFNKDGIEVVVEVGLQYLGITVLMRCPDDTKMKCVELRSTIMQRVLQTKEEFCPALKMIESFIHPTQIHYPVTIPDELYLLKDISDAVIDNGSRVVDQRGQSAVLIEELLYFEPYVELGGKLLEELFSEENSSRIVTEGFLANCADQIDTRMPLYREAIKPAKTAFEEEIMKEPLPTRQCLILLRALCHRIGNHPTYHDFHKELDKFSIFCGRNPITGVFPSNIIKQPL